MQDKALIGWCAALLACAALLHAAQPPQAAFFTRDLANPRDRREGRADILDAPVLPGSVMKAVTLVAALESHVIEPDTARMCRRIVTVDGQTYTCSHPDLRRPLTPAEALAHSCNDFFVSLAPRLTRAMFNGTRIAAGLPPVAARTRLAAAFVGLDGPRVTPRALLDVVARLAGADPQRVVPMQASTKRVLLEGLAGGARYGSASALGSAGLTALAKTGTAAMPGGGSLGIVVALAPAERPTRGVVVVAPGAAGLDAASIAADILRGQTDPTPARAPSAAPPAAARVSSASTLRVGVIGGRRTRIETMPLEDYVGRVLAGEGQPRAGDAAQQALAIAIRTFALANRNRHRREGYDLCDTTHCQVMRPATATTRRAAEATAGRVLLHAGQPAFVFYSAWCGGRPELASQVWPGAVEYGTSRPAQDDACKGEAGWSSEVTARQVVRVLNAAGMRGSRLRDLRVIQRNATGRAVRLRADGFTPAEIDGTDFRAAVGRVLGWQILKSTAFELKRTGNGYRFEGRGFGHGVGLCVVGAGARAGRGEGAEDILRFYFPSLVVGTAGAPLTTIAAVPAPDARPAPLAAADVRLALPGAEQSERDAVLRAVRQARDDIAKRAGVAPPPSIQVTVHPTVESFGRATGEPWWSSGASTGAAIDLLPVATLRRQGQFERTLRHEVAHVIVDPALRDRPMWVREGAAMYFAEPDRTAPATVRPQCPTDQELLRPESAGVQRDAYARADACFRRELARGRSWTGIR